MKEQLTELRGKIEDRRKQLSTIFEEAGEDTDMSKVTSIEGDNAAKVDGIRKLNDEIDAIAVELEPLEKAEADITRAKGAAEKYGELDVHPGHPTPGKSLEPVKAKSIGELFTDSGAGSAQKGHDVELDVNVKSLIKTTMETTVGWAPETIRTGRVVDFPTRPIQVIDAIPAGSTTQAAVVYMRETTFTNAAAETAEAGTYPESALELTEETSPVRKIATFLPVTDEQLEDVAQVRGYINNRLPFMLRQRLDSQILVGDGVAPNLEGFLNTTGILTQAMSTDSVPDAVYKAMTNIRVVGRANPGAVIIHPTDWQGIRLLQTSDGVYIWGAPSEHGTERLWGLPIVQTDAITEGTALVGDFAAFTEVTMRRGIDVKVSDSHASFFVEGKQAIRADMRVALVVYRPQALCSVTGLDG